MSDGGVGRAVQVEGKHESRPSVMEVRGVLQDLKGGQCSQSVASEGKVHKTMLERGETLEAFPLNVDNYDLQTF